MKAVLFAGGFGTRLSEATNPLVLAKALLKPFDADHTHTVSAPRK